jgi:archaellum biogenesis ATPase FlaH
MPTNTEALSYILKKGWTIQNTNGDHPFNGQGEIVVKDCPFCKDANFNFQINVHKDGSPFQCWKCDKTGNLLTLQRRLGDKPEKKGGGGSRKISSVEDMFGTQSATPTNQYKSFPREWAEPFHERLMQNENGSLEHLKARGITEDTIQAFKVGVTGEANGKPTKTPFWVFPFFSGDKIKLVKYRTMPPSKKFMMREEGMESVLFNEENLNFEEDYAVICEGEIDAMSIWQTGHSNVVSVSVGAKSFRNEWVELMESFKRIVLVYDSDEAGVAGRAEVIKRLGEERVCLVELPDGMDANDVLMKMGDGPLFEMIDRAEPMPIEGVVHISEAMEELQEQLLLGNDANAGLPWMFPGMTETLGKVEQGQLWIVTGRRGTGKTTLLKQQVVEWAEDEGAPCLIWCGEMTPRQLVRQLVQCVMGVEKADITAAHVGEAYERLRKLPIYFGYHAMNPNKEMILDIATQAYQKFGVKVVVVDNLMLITKGHKDSMEEEGRVAQAFKNWAIHYNASVLLVAHPRKISGTGGGADPNRIETADDVKGNSDVMNLADQGFNMFRKTLAPTHADSLYDSPVEMLDRKTAIISMKGRESSGKGVPFLYNEGEYSRFRAAVKADFEEEEVAHAG